MDFYLEKMNDQLLNGTWFKWRKLRANIKTIFNKFENDMFSRISHKRRDTKQNVSSKKVIISKTRLEKKDKLISREIHLNSSPAAISLKKKA